MSFSCCVVFYYNNQLTDHFNAFNSLAAALKCIASSLFAAPNISSLIAVATAIRNRPAAEMSFGYLGLGLYCFMTKMEGGRAGIGGHCGICFLYGEMLNVICCIVAALLLEELLDRGIVYLHR